MRAYLKNYRQSPRKTRLVADFVCGKSVDRALAELGFLPKRAALQLKKLLESAAANARENDKLDQKDLYIKELRVDKGITLHRFIPRARGRATPINKRTSNIAVVLAKREQQNIQDTSNPSTTASTGHGKKQTNTKSQEKVETNEPKS